MTNRGFFISQKADLLIVHFRFFQHSLAGCISLMGILSRHEDIAVLAATRTSRDTLTNDHILLQTI